MFQSGEKGRSGRMLNWTQGQIYIYLTRLLQDLHTTTSSTVLTYIKSKIFDLLGFCAALVGSSPAFRDSVSAPYSRVAMTGQERSLSDPCTHHEVYVLHTSPITGSVSTSWNQFCVLAYNDHVTSNTILSNFCYPNRAFGNTNFSQYGKCFCQVRQTAATSTRFRLHFATVSVYGHAVRSQWSHRTVNARLKGDKVKYEG
jgi:hypothetical protein